MRMKYKYNADIVRMMLDNLPSEKKVVLAKALYRNVLMTSVYVLSDCTLSVYKEGFYLQLSGTRSSFNIWAYDKDGILVFDRKPNDAKLHKLYEDSGSMNESDFWDFCKE